MCLLGYIGFKEAFSSKPLVNTTYTPNFFTENLMCPRYKDLFESSAMHREKMLQLPYEQLTIQSSDGLKLNAYYFKNPVPTTNTVILVHGYQSNGLRDNPKHCLKYLELGYNTLLVDNRASGKSEGKYLSFGIKESLDTALWCKKVAEMYPGGKIVVHGTSLGGATTCMLSNLDLPSEVKCLVADCPFISINDEFHHLAWDMFHIPSKLLVNSMEMWSKKKAGFDFKSRTPLKAVKESKLPILFIHGTEDKFIDPKSSQTLYDACTSEKDILFVEGCGHAESQLETDIYYTKVKSFIDKY